MLASGHHLTEQGLPWADAQGRDSPRSALSSDRRPLLSKDTLTITDNRTGKTYEVPIEDEHDQGDGSPADQGRGGRLRADDLRPRLHEHRLLQEPHHVHRRRQGHPALPRLPDRAARGERQLPRDGLPRSSTASCRRRRSTTSGSTTITHHTFVHENVKDLMSGFRYDAHPMGMLASTVAALSTFYPEAKKVRDAAGPAEADLPADRQDPDARRLRLPPLHGPALRLPGQRARATRATSCR